MSVIFILDDEYFQITDWKRELIRCLDTIDPEEIFHVGACSDTLNQDIQFLMIRNYESTKLIADWCNANSRRMIYSSSAANYGDSGANPSNLYGWSKYTAEDYVLNRGGLALRYFNVYGPGEANKGRMASFLYQAFLKSKSNEEIRLFPGKPQRDFIYIEDVISANIFASNNFEKLLGQYYEVSTGVAHSFEDVLEIFGFKYKYMSESSIPSGYQFFTCGKPEKWMPGWSPNYALASGILDYKLKLEADFVK